MTSYDKEGVPSVTRLTVRSLAPLIAEHRQTFDRDRRLPEQVFKALVGG